MLNSVRPRLGSLSLAVEDGNRLGNLFVTVHTVTTQMCLTSPSRAPGREKRHSPLVHQQEGKWPTTFADTYLSQYAKACMSSLSAIMLGRLRMTVDEALDHYRTFGNQVFGKARWWHERSILYCPRAKFSSKRARIAIKKVILAKLQQDNPKADYLHAATEQFRSPSDQTRTIVFAFCKDRDEGADGIHLWRTYDHEKPIGRKGSYGFGHKNPSKAHSETIWEVARSTSAAPMYFESIKLGNREFFDGGLGANNPAYYGLQEILQKDIRPPSFFLSIGTGLKPKQPSKKKKRSIAREILSDHGSRKQFVRKYFGLGRMAKGSLVDTEPIVGDWSGTCEQTGTDHWRFNVPTGLGAVPLDDWDPPKSGDETLDKITKLTDAYLATPKAQDTLDLCARQLVGVRHRRARTERWEVFGTDVEYYCPSPGCKGKDAYHYKKRKKLRTHCENTHADVLGDCLENLEAFLDAGRMSRRHVKRTCESDWRESAEKGFGNTEVLTVGNIDGEAEDGVEVETAVSRANGSGSDTSAANGANRVVAATGAVGGAEIAKASNGTATETDDGATNVPTIWIANETSNATTNRIPNTTGPATVMVVG
ncbi:hypothetical protein FQN53_000924 [Emmonsiellopsis sp. PD_33]|nr:hypothetical protein FQN53_000924 [Emmonsiellopsis sp. PD_33]